MNYLLLLGGFILLIVAGEVLVRGAAGMALKARISPLVVGLTVVSLGTSSPELFASLQAAWDGKAAVAIGNVLGSNIANLGLVLGITAMIFPIVVDEALVRRDWPVLMISSALFFAFAFDGSISHLDGVIFVLSLLAFMALLVFQARRSRKTDVLKGNDEPAEGGYSRFGKQRYLTLFGLVVLGCVGLYFGADWFIQGAVGIAESFGISEHVIGVTVVAFGTSIPELAASAVAAYRKETDISIGNLVGSNIFNILCVLGITATTTELPVQDNVISFDMPWMLGIAALLLPLMLAGRKVGRAKGALLFAYYVAYVAFLVIHETAAGH